MDMLFYLQRTSLPSPRPVQQPREIRTPFTALACGFIFNLDAGIGRQPGGTSGAGQRLLLPLPWAGSSAGCRMLGLRLGKQHTGFPCCPALPRHELSGQLLPVKRNPIKALFRYLKLTSHDFARKKKKREKKKNNKKTDSPHTPFFKSFAVNGPSLQTLLWD